MAVMIHVEQKWDVSQLNISISFLSLTKETESLADIVLWGTLYPLLQDPAYLPGKNYAHYLN